MTYQERLDMFAAAALTGMLANYMNGSVKATAQHSYEYAKAMIEESDRICAEKK